MIGQPRLKWHLPPSERERQGKQRILGETLAQKSTWQIRPVERPRQVGEAPEPLYQMTGRPAIHTGYFPNPWREIVQMEEYTYAIFSPEWGGENQLWDGANQVTFFKSEIL